MAAYCREAYDAARGHVGRATEIGINVMQPLLALAAVAAMNASSAGAATFNVLDHGWYQGGLHHPANPNTFTGVYPGDGEYRSWYAFDVSSASEASAISIRFLGGNGFLATDSGAETIRLFDYTGSVSDLVAGSAGAAGFDDLGSGTVLGEQTISGADLSEMPEFTASLNTAFVSAFNAVRVSRDPRLALGAALVSISANGAREEAFWWGSLAESAAVLIVTEVRPVTEPAAIGLLGLGVLGIAGTRHARKKASIPSDSAWSRLSNWRCVDRCRAVLSSTLQSAAIRSRCSPTATACQPAAS